MYLIRLAMRPWRKAFWSQLVSGLAMAALLVMGSFLIWLQQGLGPVISRMDREQVITAYVDPQLAVTEDARLADRIRLKLGAKSVEVRAVSSEQFIDDLKGNYPELAKELEGLGGEMQSLIPRYISASGVFAPDAGEQLRKVPGVESVETSRERYKPIAGAFTALRKLALLLALGLGVALATGLVHLARMNGQLLSESLGILRLWGASAGALRVPALVSGASVGALGGVVAGGLWLFAGAFLSANLGAFSPLLQQIPAPTAWSALWVAGAGVFSGALAGTLNPGESRS